LLWLFSFTLNEEVKEDFIFYLIKNCVCAGTLCWFGFVAKGEIKEELKRQLTEKDGLNLELEKVKAELEEYKKNERKSATPNEPAKEAKLKSVQGRQAAK